MLIPEALISFHDQLQLHHDVLNDASFAKVL